MFRLLSKQILKATIVHHYHPVRVISTTPRRNIDDSSNNNKNHFHDTPSRGSGSKPDSASFDTWKGAAQLDNGATSVRLDHLESGQKEMRAEMRADFKDLSNSVRASINDLSNKMDKALERVDKAVEHMDNKFQKTNNYIFSGLSLIICGLVGFIGKFSYDYIDGLHMKAVVAERRFTSSLAPLVEKRVEQPVEPGVLVQPAVRPAVKKIEKRRKGFWEFY